MNRRRFVFTSLLSLLVITVAVAGLALFSNFTAKAFVPELPNAIHYLPADAAAVFGMNVQKFVASPVYDRFMAQHGQEIGTDLAEFIAKTGVDPRKDITYIIAAGRPSQQKDAGVAIAVGRFDPATITSFISSKVTPINVDYKGANVLMIPEANGTKLEKGIAFLTASEIALGDLDSLKAVLDVRSQAAPSIDSTSLAGLLRDLNSNDMFWFAGSPAGVVSKLPANTPFVPSLAAVQNVFGTLNLTTKVEGKITVTATTDETAGQLAEFVRGLIALGNLAGAQNPDLVELIRNVQVAQRANQFDVSVSFPIELLQKLEASKAHLFR
jgi:hypothetical protein